MKRFVFLSQRNSSLFYELLRILLSLKKLSASSIPSDSVRFEKPFFLNQRTANSKLVARIVIYKLGYCVIVILIEAK